MVNRFFVQVYIGFVVLESLISNEVFSCSWKKLNAEKFLLKEKQHM